MNYGKTIRVAALAATAGIIGPAQAGVPLNNLEGVGGVAYNPLAYLAGQNASTNEPDNVFSKPQTGVWGVRLFDRNITWGAVGVAESIGGRIELSYGYETIRLGQADDKDISKHNIGVKGLLIPENQFGPWVPAVAVGTIWKTTDGNLVGPDKSGADFYAVATKLITQTPLPVLISGGLLETDEEVTGVLGHNSEYDLTWFGNIDVLPLPDLATGFEYKQGARFSTFSNASYWDLHAAYFVNPHLTLVAAYTYTGNADSTAHFGLGDGAVLSAQYAF